MGTFLKSGNPVVESERVTYVFQGSGNKLYVNLEISELKKDDSGIFYMRCIQSWNCGYQQICTESR